MDKKKLIIIGGAIALVIIIALICVFTFLKSIPSNYYAKISSETNAEKYYIYFYLKDSKATYIKTTAQIKNSKDGKEKITKKASLEYPQDIFEIIAENDLGYFITINENVPKTETREAIKKGDTISPMDFWALIAKN